MTQTSVDILSLTCQHKQVKGNSVGNSVPTRKWTPHLKNCCVGSLGSWPQKLEEGLTFSWEQMRPLHLPTSSGQEPEEPGKHRGRSVLRCGKGKEKTLWRNLQLELKPKNLEWAMCAHWCGECSKDGPLGFYWFVLNKMGYGGFMSVWFIWEKSVNVVLPGFWFLHY